MLRPGSAAGVLLGGTLTQLTASLGTPYAFDPPPSNPVGESEFEWSPVEDMAELRSESSDEFEIERGFTFETVVAEELASTSDEAIATAV